MRIRVLECESGEANPRVTFATSCGSGVGSWAGPAPAVGSEYFVEFQSDAALQLTTNANRSDTRTQGLALSGESVTISAVLEMITGEVTGIFRFCDGSIELDLVDIDEWTEGEFYQIRLRHLSLFDQQL